MNLIESAKAELERLKSAEQSAFAERQAAMKRHDKAADEVRQQRLIVTHLEMQANADVPVDRNARTLTDGSPVTEDHRDILPSGQQKGYVVLSDAERAKGFVRPVRDAYRHTKCNGVTTMGRSLAETYARDPSFYSGTFCCNCGAHFPVGEDGEFTWLESDGQELHKVGT